jgi:hypothetical protein
LIGGDWKVLIFGGDGYEFLGLRRRRLENFNFFWLLVAAAAEIF